MQSACDSSFVLSLLFGSTGNNGTPYRWWCLTLIGSNGGNMCVFILIGSGVSRAVGFNNEELWMLSHSVKYGQV